MSETKVQRYRIELTNAETNGERLRGEVSVIECDDGEVVKEADCEKAIAAARAEGKREGLREAAEYHMRIARSSAGQARSLGAIGSKWCQNIIGEDLRRDASREARDASNLRKMAREVEG